MLNYVELVYKFMRSESKVNQSYAAACLDKLLLKKSKTTGQMIITRESMNDAVVQELLGAICDVLNEDQNWYVLRAFYRVIATTQDKITAVAQPICNVLGSFIDKLSEEDDVNQQYANTLFEATALCLRFFRLEPLAIKLMSDTLTPVLNKIIQNNKLDVIGYAFQIYALFVAHTAENNPVFQTLTQSIVTTPGNWAHDMRYLMPS